MKTSFIVRLASPRLGYGNVVLQNPHSVSVPEGVTAVIGPNGAGKSTLGLVIEKGRYAYGNRLEFTRPDMKVRMITFTDIHSLTGIEVTRHDQRLEATVNDLVPTVGEILGQKAVASRFTELCETFALRDITDKRVNYLSSGELRKLLIINALVDAPDLLILDNPYIGLDAISRGELDKALTGVSQTGTSIMMLLCDPADIPDYTDAVLPINDRIVGEITTDSNEIARLRCPQSQEESTISSTDIPPARGEEEKFDIAFSITDGHLRYGSRSIIEGLEWTVGRGERWALMGPNGSGKSLLLSLICADNPQAYANRITLFDRRRGSGESIWEIKDRIGYVCPEMQLYFRSSLPVVEIVAAGLRNALSQFRKPTSDELVEARTWLGLVGIGGTADRSFTGLSSGEQRLVLLARTFIKQPPLLILDEPLHGLDPEHKRRVREIIDMLALRNGTTIIFVSHYANEIPSSVTKTMRLEKNPS